MSSLQAELGAGSFSVHIATTATAIEDLRPVWQNWSHSLDTDIDYYLHNLRSDPAILCPYVITVYQAGAAQGMLVGMLTERKASAIVSFVRISGPTAKILEIVNGGRVGRRSAVIDNLIALQLSIAIKCEKIVYMCFHRLPINSEFLTQLNQVPRLGFKQHLGHTIYDSILPLTAREGRRAPVFSGKIMREVRRKSRNLQRAFPSKTRFRCYSDPAELAGGVADAITTAAATWQYPLGYGLLNTVRIREDFKFFAKQGWLRIYVLYVDDLPRSFLIGQLYKNTFYCQYSGYHSGFARYSVGSLLTAWALESLAEAGVQQVDLGDGSQEYNRRQGCETHENVRLHIYPRTLRSLWLRTFFAVTHTSRVAVRRITSELGLNQIGKIWRDFLVTRSNHRHIDLRFQVNEAADRWHRASMWDRLQVQLHRRRIR